MVGTSEQPSAQGFRPIARREPALPELPLPYFTSLGVSLKLAGNEVLNGQQGVGIFCNALDIHLYLGSQLAACGGDYLPGPSSSSELVSI